MLGTQNVSAIRFRAACTADTSRLIEILNDPPPPEVLAMVGSVSTALVVGRMLFDAGFGINLTRTTVAEIRGSVAGFMDGGKGDGDREPGAATIARLLPPLLFKAGPAAVLRGMQWMRINPRVQFGGDPAAYHISELNVAAARRGEGIGRRLLELAEEQALAAGCPRLTLSTKITNPARRLYERFGFAVTGEKRDAEWSRWALSPGRVWMVKELG